MYQTTMKLLKEAFSLARKLSVYSRSHLPYERENPTKNAIVIMCQNKDKQKSLISSSLKKAKRILVLDKNNQRQVTHHLENHIGY